MAAKNVLIIYPYNNHINLVSVFTQKLYDKGLVADAICLSGCHVIRHSQIRWGWLADFVTNQCKKESLTGKLFRRFFLKFTIYTILKKYDLIDFHAFVNSDIKLAKYCQKKKIKYDITFWGSDIMRASDSFLKLMKDGLDNCRCVKSSENLHDVLVEKYGNQYDSKHRIVYFGNNYDDIDALSIEECRDIAIKLYGDTSSKKIVVCGYNGSRYQNHKSMIQAFKNLCDKYGSSIHLVFPMTYGAQPEYISEIKELLNCSGYSFTLLDRFLPNEDVVAIRKTADFVVNIQETDAFSGSLKAHLYCNEVLLIGEWLKYTLLERDNVFYIKTSMQNLTESIDDALSNLEKYKKSCEGNREKMRKMTLWDNVINKWIVAYGK